MSFRPSDHSSKLQPGIRMRGDSNCDAFINSGGRGDLAVTSRLHGRRLTPWVKRPPAGMMRKFEEEVPAHVPSSSSHRSSK
ncbi:hypothetical protein AVEN_86419-1 [Araneus ventricosus]|uniref:Uncharacterized protein n=1 Tax=Araneus ventricosus TaxID=182803 RepID=A0A4Y2KV65_ARAVE|nr:hypothetical protein AVEN_86419-1 [Araneus ventricosus]